MGYQFKCSGSHFILVLVLVLLQLTSSMITTRNSLSEAEDQRLILKDLFHKALINDSGQLFNLQKVFLAPRRQKGYRFVGPLCVKVNVSVGKIINDSKQFGGGLRCQYPYYNETCTSIQVFELAPSDDRDHKLCANTETLASFLGIDIIVIALKTLDPFYYYCLDELFYTNERPFYCSYSYSPTYLYNSINISIDQIKTMPSAEEVTDALSVTLSWVSLVNYKNMERACIWYLVATCTTGLTF